MSILTKSKVGLQHKLIISWKGNRYCVLVKSVTIEDIVPGTLTEPGSSVTYTMKCVKPSWFFDEPIQVEHLIKSKQVRVTLNIVFQEILSEWINMSYPPAGEGFMYDPEERGWMTIFKNLQIMGGINNILMMTFSEMRLVETTSNVHS